MLGWHLEFRELKAALTDGKFNEWLVGIQRILDSGESTISELETIVGRNGHTCQVITLGYHLQNILKIKNNRKANGKCKIK